MLTKTLLYTRASKLRTLAGSNNSILPITDMMAQRTSPPFRAEHLGSFKRPEVVIANRQEYEQGKCSFTELARCEDEAIAEVVKLQKDMGLRTITDGEFRR